MLFLTISFSIKLMLAQIYIDNIDNIFTTQDAKLAKLAKLIYVLLYIKCITNNILHIYKILDI